MKLQNLFETNMVASELIPVLQTNLVMAVGEEVGRGEYMYTLIIIKDVPLISKEKYDQLFKLSFPLEDFRDDINVFAVQHSDGIYREDPEEWFEWHEEHETDIYSLTWKRFIERVKESYANDDDDFDE